MRLALRPHPDSLCFPATHVDVAVARPRADCLVLSYAVTGRISDMRIPPALPPARRDGLWRRTCFEAFLRAAPDAGYFEFNLAPSTQWAVYRFTGYRAGMRVAAEINALPIDIQSNPDRFTLQARLALDGLADLPLGVPWSLALSAVIEDKSGRISYWALAHAPGPPDFHHPDGFAHALPAASIMLADRGSRPSCK